MTAATAARERRLDLEDVGFTFHVADKKGTRDIRVLSDVNLSVAGGEFCCIIGPSGCGKSTLLRVIDGLFPPTDGRVVVDGDVLTAPRPNIGMVFQSFNLLPWRTVEANVELGLEQRGVPRRARRVRSRSWLQRVGLEGFETFYPAQLSGGMQQRVGLARALAVEPDILLMDEPFGSLDAQTRVLMQGELMDLWSADRKTVVFVTHDVEEALFLADRVVVLSARPGHILDVVDVPFPRPRSRADPEFARLRETLWEGLRLHPGVDAVPQETRVPPAAVLEQEAAVREA
ncbi:MAG: ABC transporter ATP-binding protein [Acidimicrobiales bacterium]